MENKKELKAISFKCSGCGTTLKFDPASQNLKCSSCGKIELLEKGRSQTKHDVSSTLDDKHDRWAQTSKIMKCQTCGAEIILSGLEFSGICPYCSSSYVSDANYLPDFVPDSIVPFAFDEVEAEKRLKTQLKRKFYVPTKCKREVRPENIKGIYIPAFAFDADVKADYNGTLSRKTENNETEYFHISGVHHSRQRDVLIENSSKITQSTLKKILPYDLSQTYRFTEGFVLGYVVEHYEDAFKVCLNKALKEMEQKVKQEILNGYSYSAVKEFNMKCDFSSKKYQYHILPIYQMNFEYRKKNYNIIMNGQNGKIGGKLPTSVLKVLFTIFGWLLVIALIIWISSL